MDELRSVNDFDPPREAAYEQFLELFAANRDRLYAYVYSLLPHHADAEDVFQRCSILLWRKFDQFDREGSFLAWGCGVAFYEVRNFLRSANRDRLQFDVDLVSRLAELRQGRLHETERRLEALRQCVQNLKAPERELVYQFYHCEGTLKDFAEASGKALQTLYNRLSRIRRKLLECVQRKLALEGATS